jgi:hypothetical protein
MFRRSSVIFLAALTAVLPGPAPASAAEPVPWTMTPCATAFLGRVARDTGVPWFVIFGEATRCAPGVVGEGVRLAVYKAGKETGYSAGYHVRLFDTADVPREFGVAIVQPIPGEYGVCVLAGEHSRVTCVRVTIGEDGRTAVSERIDPDDPLVAKELGTAAPYQGSVYPPESKGTNPTCATCF